MMKVFNNKMGAVIELPIELADIVDVNIRAAAAFGIISQKYPPSAPTRVIHPFEMSYYKWGFIWLTLPEHQGSYEHSIYLIGNWVDPGALLATTPEEDAAWEEWASTQNEYLPEYQAIEANGWFRKLGIQEEVSEEEYASILRRN